MPTIIDLLNAINGGQQLPPVPNPARPVIPLPTPTSAPVFNPTPTMDEPPQAPLDLNILRQYQALAGPAPTPPPPASRLDRIAAALQGFGIGVRGGDTAGFIRQLQQPQREYQQRLDAYNNNVADLRLRGSEVALRDQERRTARTQALADRDFERQVAAESRRLNLQDDLEKERLRDILLARRQLADDARAAEEQRRRERTQRERDARLIARDYGKVGAKPAIARELGAYYSGLTDSLSKEAAQFESAQARLQEARIRRTTLGGVGGSGVSAKAQQALATFDNAKGLLVNALRTGDYGAEQNARRQMMSAFNALSRFPAQIERGYDPTGQWPYAKMIGAQPPAQPQAATKSISRAEMQALNITEQEARAEGYTITP